MRDDAAHSWRRANVRRLAWFALLFAGTAGLALYAAAVSFPLPGGSAPREGLAKLQDSVGQAIIAVMASPFSWVYKLVEDKIAGLLIWLLWAAGLYGVSALLRRPRWVFGGSHELPAERTRNRA